MTRTFMAVMFAMGLFLTGTQAKAAFTLSYSTVTHSVPPAGTDLMTIFCPTGTKVVSGGWDSTPSTGQYLMVWVSRQIGNSWRIMTVNTHPTAFVGINGYAVCASGVSGLSTYSVSSGPINVPALSEVAGAAPCTSPDIVTGGGFDSNFPDPLKLVPTASTPFVFSQWYAAEYNPTGFAKTFTVYGTCATNVNGSVARARGFPVTLPPQSWATSTVDCAPGDFAVGGGYAIALERPIGALQKVRMFGNLPTTTNPRRWTAKAFNTNGFDDGASFAAFATCLHLN